MRAALLPNVVDMSAVLAPALAVVPTVIIAALIAVGVVTRRRRAARTRLADVRPHSGIHVNELTDAEIDTLRAKGLDPRLCDLLAVKTDPALAKAWESVIAGAAEWKRKHG